MLPLRSHTIDLTHCSAQERHDQLQQLHQHMDGVITHCSPNDFADNETTGHEEQYKIRVFTHGVELAGFMSWRVENVLIDGKLFSVHRSYTVIKPEYRGVHSEKFIMSEILKYNVRHLFRPNKSLFLCLAMGPVTYYVFNKYIPKVYPSPDSKNDKHLEDLALKLSEHYKMDVTQRSPLKVLLRSRLKEPEYMKQRWFHRKDKSVRFFLEQSQFYKNEQSGNDAILMVFPVGIYELFYAGVLLIKSHGASWILGRRNQRTNKEESVALTKEPRHS